MYMLECFLYFSEDKNELVRAMVKMNQDGQSTIAGIINQLFFFTPRQNEGYCHHNVVVCGHFLVRSITRLNLI